MSILFISYQTFFDTMYNIFVFPLEILLNLIVLFLDKSWIFSKKIRRRTVCYTYCDGFKYIGYSESASLLPHKQNPFPDLYQSDIRNPLRYFLINKIRFRILFISVSEQKYRRLL